MGTQKHSFDHQWRRRPPLDLRSTCSIDHRETIPGSPEIPIARSPKTSQTIQNTRPQRVVSITIVQYINLQLVPLHRHWPCDWGSAVETEAFGENMARCRPPTQQHQASIPVRIARTLVAFSCVPGAPRYPPASAPALLTIVTPSGRVHLDCLVSRLKKYTRPSGARCCSHVGRSEPACGPPGNSAGWVHDDFFSTAL